MNDIWHSEPLPGAVVVDLTAPGSIELVMEIHRMDEHRKPTDELEAILRLDPTAKLPKPCGVRPRRVYRKPNHIYFAFPIFRVTKRSKKHGTTKR